MIDTGQEADAAEPASNEMGTLVIALIAILVRVLTAEGPLTAGRIALGVFVGVLPAAAVLFIGIIFLGGIASLL